MNINHLPLSLINEDEDFSKGGPLLSINDLRVWFELRRFGFGRAGHVKAVDGVSFDLSKGESIAIVGESGCGKSSLMKTILALYKPTAGHISFIDQDLGKMNESRLRWYHGHVGYVQQDPYGALASFMTVKRILEEPLIILAQRGLKRQPTGGFTRLGGSPGGTSLKVAALSASGTEVPFNRASV